MRPDEEFVKSALKTHFGSTLQKIENGNDPPDCYLLIHGQKIPLEITQLTSITFNSRGEPTNRLSQDVPLARICDELNQQYGDLVDEGKQLGLHIIGPADHPRLFQKELARMLPEIINEIRKSHDGKMTHIIDGVPVEFRLYDERHKSANPIACIIQNARAENDLQRNASEMLRERISKKARKLEDFFAKGQVWLALYNRDILLDEIDYQVAYESLDLEHRFERVFIILSNGDVHELT